MSKYTVKFISSPHAVFTASIDLSITKFAPKLKPFRNPAATHPCAMSMDTVENLAEHTTRIFLVARRAQHLIARFEFVSVSATTAHLDTGKMKLQCARRALKMC